MTTTTSAASGPARSTGSTGSSGSGRPGMFGALGVRHYPALLVAGWLWNMCRWASGFLGAYVVNHATGSARLVQLTGVSLWAPLLLGGVAGGMVSDRFDRRRTVVTQFLVLIPLAALMGVAELSGGIRLWMLYPFLVLDRKSTRLNSSHT